ncbi:hypothetical protein CRENBAI_007616 [Crenichthys baileyi]|uniref:Neuronal tyrosine-phosphorylated phosphoinositide-3-kinase adapter C-terminal domain-containing protein n=1 Tax=Crenichthys baileyi TaxID=28760 RepID=A0AAV9SJM2_9TELE
MELPLPEFGFSAGVSLSGKNLLETQTGVVVTCGLGSRTMLPDVPSPRGRPEIPAARGLPRTANVELHLESKTVDKLGRSASTSGVPSPGGTPQRHLHESHHPALSQMPWLCGDPTMMEMIEKKRVLCREIKARQRPEKNLCKQDSMPNLPSWRRKQPPPYSAPPSATGHTATVFWDTAI